MLSDFFTDKDKECRQKIAQAVDDYISEHHEEFKEKAISQGLTADNAEALLEKVKRASEEKALGKYTTLLRKI